MSVNTPTRWPIPLAGALLHLCLGTVYAWSFFQKPLTSLCGWSNSAVAWTFSLAICFLGLAAAWGGLRLRHANPRPLALAGAGCYALGWLLGGLALQLQSLPLLYLGFGVLGGIGLGLAYVTAVTTAARWFPDRKGRITGLVVMGFGLGALVMSKFLAPALLAWTHQNLVAVFICTGLLLAAVGLPAAAFLRNPPGLPAASPRSRPTLPPGEPSSYSVLRSPRFVLLWLIFFCNIAAGMMFVSFQSPMLQDLLYRADPTWTAERLAAAGATLIALSSLANGLGRFLWGGLSDRLGRTWTFRLILASQMVVFAVLPQVALPWLFGLLVCYVLLCYGGGFGAMPAFVLDVFGELRMPMVYGAVLTAWSAAGIAGPQLVAAIRDLYPAHAGPYSFALAAGLLASGLLLSAFLNDTPIRSASPRRNERSTQPSSQL